MKRGVRRDTGPLRDPEPVPGKRDARMALFWGAIGVFKNPTSHHPVDYNPTVAAEAEAVLLADLLPRMLDDAAPLWPPG